VVKFFKEGQTERGRRIIAAVEANEERRRRLVPASGWVPASR
jgi:hypothetical protein